MIITRYIMHNLAIRLSFFFPPQLRAMNKRFYDTLKKQNHSSIKSLNKANLDCSSPKQCVCDKLLSPRSHSEPLVESTRWPTKSECLAQFRFELFWSPSTSSSVTSRNSRFHHCNRRALSSPHCLPNFGHLKWNRTKRLTLNLTRQKIFSTPCRNYLFLKSKIFGAERVIKIVFYF